MKYVKFIFENQDVRSLTEANSPFIDIASNIVINKNIILEENILDNLEQFISNGSSVSEIYESIRDHVVHENLELYSEINAVLSDTTISDEEKAKILVEAEQQSGWWAKNGGKVKHAAVLLAAGGTGAALHAYNPEIVDAAKKMGMHISKVASDVSHEIGGAVKATKKLASEAGENIMKKIRGGAEASEVNKEQSKAMSDASSGNAGTSNASPVTAAAKGH